MTDDHFSSPKRRIRRAIQHIANLEAEVERFSDSKPYINVREMDADGVTQLCKIKLANAFPDGLGDIAADAVDNLRSALDQIGYAAAVASNSSSLKHTAFPFGKTVSDVDNAIRGRSKDIPAEVTAVFRAFEPHEAGHNGALWALNQLCIANKHTALVPVGTHVSQVTLVSGMELRGNDVGVSTWNPPMWNSDIWDNEKSEMIYARLAPGAFMSDVKFDFTFHVVFGDVPILKGEPALPVLRYLSNLVENIGMATETECRRLGFI
jgi:hypothetical protein